MRVARLGGAVIGLLAALVLSMTTPAGAATEPVSGTATTSGGNGLTTTDFVYTSPGVLGSGTLHFDFTLTPVVGGFVTQGTGLLTRTSDGATLSGTESGTVDLTTNPFPVVIHFQVTSGTGALTGATGEIVLTGTSRGPGVVGDVFTMSGTISTRVPTGTDECKRGGWRDLLDDDGEPFRNQGDCVSFVQRTKHAA
jgi:hypothetical protein